MDFVFSEEQEMLRASARSFLRDRFPEDRVAELAESDGGWDPSSWQQIAELGWIGLSSPGAVGGAGMSLLEEAVLFEELGYALYPGPYLATVAASLPALEGSERLLARVMSGEVAATFAVHEEGRPLDLGLDEQLGTTALDDGGWKLSGDKINVRDLGAAEVLVVLASTDGGWGLWAVDSGAAEVEVLSTMDATRRLGRIHLAHTPAECLVLPGEAESVLMRTGGRVVSALALESVGIAQRALDLALAHAGSRTQFGKPIGSYQAVSHQISDTYMGVELARSLAYWAAWCVSENDPQAGMASAAAKAYASEVAVLACERSIQVHGGTGFTWEHILHRLYKRAQGNSSFSGDPTFHRRHIANGLFA
ncbi:MAG: acyl-CoA dehydrogenase family protein [Actinomycetota bacterium]